MKKPRIDTSAIADQVVNSIPGIARDVFSSFTGAQPDEVEESGQLPPPNANERHGAPSAAPAPPTGSPVVSDLKRMPVEPGLADKLLRLAELRQQGLLTEEEFAAAKQSLL